MKRQHFRKEEVIIRQGQAGDCMYRIESGMVEVFLDYETENRRKLDVLSAENCFGEMSPLGKCPHL